MPQVPLAEHNDMIETFPADGADQALRMAVLPGANVVMSDDRNTEGTNTPNEQIALTGIPVADQVVQGALPAEGLCELVG
jgi:hypothetical protein